MQDFYEEWLELWKRDLNERQKARKVIYPEELEWLRTRQDYKAALLVSPETGFKTLGSVTMIGEIPRGWKTGKHIHGEEAVYILQGKGFSVIGDSRYNWTEGSCLRIPFGVPHQHFNDDNTTVRYYSALAPHFEKYFSICKFNHIEDCGPYSAAEPKISVNMGNHDSGGRRIIMHKDEAQAIKQSQNEKNLWMMGEGDFVGNEVEITGVLIDQPRMVQEKHAHMEAILYIMEGEGYSMIDEKRYDWRPGTAIHIQGPQTIHQHFTIKDVPSRQLRTHFIIRKYLQDLTRDVFPYLHHLEGREYMKPF